MQKKGDLILCQWYNIVSVQFHIRSGPVLLKLTLFPCWTHTDHISWVISDPLTMSYPHGFCTRWNHSDL